MGEVHPLLATLAEEALDLVATIAEGLRLGRRGKGLGNRERRRRWEDANLRLANSWSLARHREVADRIAIRRVDP